ncbi:hypothetical protein ACGFNZ_53775, partial [Streptomyces mirabilis]
SFALEAKPRSLPCSAGVRFLPGLKAGASSEEQVKSGAITQDGQGHGRTDDLSLPDGHYKLFWNFDGEKGAA